MRRLVLVSVVVVAAATALLLLGIGPGLGGGPGLPGGPGLRGGPGLGGLLSGTRRSSSGVRSGSGSGSGAKSLSLRQQAQGLEQRMLKSLQTKPSVVGRVAPQPPVQGYSCPAAAGSPCGKPPCTVYAAPARFALAVPLRSAPCAKALARQLPAMAR